MYLHTLKSNQVSIHKFVYKYIIMFGELIIHPRPRHEIK